jgi:transcription elongation GreA/GreB family factor
MRDELVAQLEAQLATARAAHAAAIEGATHPEAKAENDKDTRGLEQSYIARGQAQRVAELEAAIDAVKAMQLRTFGDDAAVAISALVVVDEDGDAHRYWLAPHGGGATLAGDVSVVTLGSPLGRALLGKHAGDEIELPLAGKRRVFEITSID